METASAETIPDPDVARVSGGVARSKPVKPVGLDAPGCALRSGVVYWIAQRNSTYTPKTARLWSTSNGRTEPTDDEWQHIARECGRLQREMLAWNRAQQQVTELKSSTVVVPADDDETWHPQDAHRIFSNFAVRMSSSSDDKGKVICDAAFALYIGRHDDSAIGELSDRAIARGIHPELVQAAIAKGQERAVEHDLGDKKHARRGIGQGPNGMQENPAPDEPIEPLEMFDAGDWEGVPTEPRQWITLEHIPAGEPGILSGDGGTGKTMIALQLGCSVGAEWPDWLGKLLATHGPVIFYSVEEKLAEFHRRASWVLESRQASFGILRKRFFFIGDQKGETILARADRNLVLPTKTLLRLEKSVALVKPALIVIENAADVFAGNENDRALVHPFVRGLLGGLCNINGATMMLLQHPSVSGLNDGTGRSGTTGWNNAGRWRLNFKDANDRNDDTIDDGRRQLITVKTNYGRRGEKINIQWKDGIFIPEGSQPTFQRAAADARIDEAFMRCLDAATAQGRTISDSSGRNYAPTLFEKMPEANGINKRAFELAMPRLFTAKRIKVETEGKGSHAKKRLTRT